MDKSKRFSWGKRKPVRGQLSPVQIIAIVFAAIILLGTVLLTLPVASRDGAPTDPLSALFTATSATCVTGLVVFDTWTHWSGFGQAVILSMIEIGGLGFVSAVSLFVFIFRRKVGLRQRMVMAQALSMDDMADALRLQKWVLTGSLGIQLVGAAVLMLRFLPEYGFQDALWWGIFHAISAFCNAGFDVFGSIAPGQSLILFNDDPVVLITLMLLVCIGGLGFFVWEELVRIRRFRKFSVYTKLVLVVTAAAIFGGAALFALLEWNNPGTFGQMPAGQKILNAFFQSVTLRTSGFVSVDQAALTDASKGIGIILMLIGGSSGSTAGGMKTVTFAVLLLFVWTRCRGRNSVSVFNRAVPGEKVMDAMTIAALMIGLPFLGAIIITATSPVGFMDALYEAVSALATVGLTAGATPVLSTAAKLVLIVFMYFGRVGLLTISLGFLIGDKAEERFRYAYTNLLIG